MATIDYKTFLQVIHPIINARFPVLVRGRHGIGKSTIVYQLADDLKLPVVERRASQMTEGDLLGLPKLAKNVTTWCPPEWLAMACKKPVVHNTKLVKWIPQSLTDIPSLM
jgi:MoxR-like ATPase